VIPRIGAQPQTRWSATKAEERTAEELSHPSGEITELERLLREVA
jgi:hypothetical protein